MFNDVKNWLKHIKPPDEIEITDFDAAISITRATSKSIAVFRESSPTIEDFVAWLRQNGHLSPQAPDSKD
jgi:hypothetical protein